MNKKMKIPSIKEMPDLNGKVVLLRLDFNVSIQNGKIENDFRLRRSLPTIEYLRSKKAKVVMMSHIESEGVNSLSVIAEYYQKLFPLTFITDPVEALNKERFKEGEEGGVFLLENIRNYEGEKKNDPEFARRLASLGDMYVNDAFAVSHRAHASIVGIPKELPSYMGFVMEDEIENLSLAFSPKKPFLFILGGAKFDTKLPLVKKFLDIADSVYICGALANDCFKALGFSVGKSVVSVDNYDLAHIVKNKKIILPKDVIVKKGDALFQKYPDKIESDEVILDAGEEALLELKKIISDSNFVLWNGPLGLYEAGFKKSTLDAARMITESQAESIVGGGDTLSAIDELHIEDKFTFVSTGGGAMLDFLANETLPGIEALKS